jgi:hypothetical protein
VTWRSVWVNAGSVIAQSQLDSACSSRAVLSRKHQLEKSSQLSWLCACGRKPVVLKGLCRLCYHRCYHSLRFFGGLREAVLRRDRFRCRVCGSSAPLLVHHRNGLNERRLLITLCISCHVRLHRYRGFSRWIPRFLLELWSEIHPGQPLQLQLPLGISTRAADEKAGPARTGGRVAHGLFYCRAEMPSGVSIAQMLT